MKQLLEENVFEQNDVNRVHYLPHHAVRRRDKETSKVGIVYDASVSENGPSLNTSLHTGPKSNQKMWHRRRKFPMEIIDL